MEIQKYDYSNPENYVKIGGEYYAKDYDGNFEDKVVKRLKPWKLYDIRQNMDKNSIKEIEEYFDFANVASHTNYQSIIKGNYYNLYKPLSYKRKKGSYKTIEKFLKLMFREDYTMMLDWISILYQNPEQNLPIPALVSEENKTGKTTFLYLLKKLFEQNMKTIRSGDLTNEFNSSWTSLLLVAIEEATWYKDPKPYNYMKATSTASEIEYHAKGKDKTYIKNHLHFIICSNNEDDFMMVDQIETRLWVIQVPNITEYIQDLKTKIDDEISAFAEFIATREIEYLKNNEPDRFVFHPTKYRTEALEKLILNSTPQTAKDIRYEIKEYFLRFPEEKSLSMTPKDMIQNFTLKSPPSANQLNTIFDKFFPKAKERLHYKTERYYYCDFKTGIPINGSGRPTTFYREDFIKDEEPPTQPPTQPTPPTPTPPLTQPPLTQPPTQSETVTNAEQTEYKHGEQRKQQDLRSGTRTRQKHNRSTQRKKKKRRR